MILIHFLYNFSSPQGGWDLFPIPEGLYKAMEIKLNKTYFKAILDALKIQAYRKDMCYTDRLPYLRAYHDLEYKGKLEERKRKKGVRK